MLALSHAFRQRNAKQGIQIILKRQPNKRMVTTEIWSDFLLCKFVFESTAPYGERLSSNKWQQARIDEANARVKIK